MIKQPPTRVSPRQGARILLRVDSYEIPADIVAALKSKIQDACANYHNGVRGATALRSSRWVVGNSCRHSINLEDLFAWYELHSDMGQRGATATRLNRPRANRRKLVVVGR